jgi:hypothetical protein
MLDHLITIDGRIWRHSMIVLVRVSVLLRVLDINVGQVGLAHLYRLVRSLKTTTPVRIGVIVKTGSVNLLPRQATISKQAHDAKANAENHEGGCGGYEDYCPLRIGGGARGGCREIRLIREKARLPDLPHSLSLQ